MSRILVTGVGAAAGIAAAKHLLKNKHYVYGVNCLEYSAGFNMVDDYSVVPYAIDKSYITELINICKKNNIEYLIPTVDEELPKISENRDKFEQIGVRVLISSPSTIESCLDKYKFYESLYDASVKVAKAWKFDSDIELENIKYPLIAKPRTGRGGRGIYIINSNYDLKYIEGIEKKYILQEYIEGIEYSVDTLSDLKGNCLVAVPRSRLEIKGGVCWKGKIEKNVLIVDEAKKAVEKLGIVGPACLQLILGKDNSINIFEVNPRIGGTVSLSINAGVDIPELSLRILNKEHINEDELKYKELFISRYFEETFFYVN